MGVIPIGHQTLTPADVRAIAAYSASLLDRGLASACLPVETEDGELVVALVGCDGESLLCAFGKDQGWYYVTDPEGVPLAHGRLLGDVLIIVARFESQCPPLAERRQSHG